MKTTGDSGVVLVAVLCFTAITAILALGLLTESGGQLTLANRQMNMEQAFYVAEGGAERAVSYITRVGVTVTTNITGSIGNGIYMTFIVPSGGSHALSGSLGINPNNSADNEFVLIKPDGTTITRDDLADDIREYDSVPCVYYSGSAILVHVKPKGNGNQNTLLVDGAIYTVENSTTYDFVGEMNVIVQNDSRNNGNHRANGHWFLGSIGGNDIAIADSSGATSAGTENYEIHSIGTVNGIRRNVILNGVHQQSWAKYALWYNSGPGAIWIKSGEQFDGPVHANTDIYLKEDPVFNALISSTSSSWGNGQNENSNTNMVHFNAGYLLNAPMQSMASINFSNLVSYADMIVTGTTAIILSGTNMLISNSRGGWTSSVVALPSNGLIYVKNATNTPNLSKTGTVSVAGTLNGRLSIASDYDIQITNHITYANTNITLGLTNTSDDALGLIAKHDVIVMTNAPNNLNIYAHIIAEGSATAGLKDGSFYVQNYSDRANSGKLNVYGGIVQYYRGAVGTAGVVGHTGYTNGFIKNYTFDRRFTDNPPPQYPALTNEYQWTDWRDKSR